MVDRLIRRPPEQVINSAPFVDSGQPRGRQHWYARVWEFLKEEGRDFLVFPLTKVLPILAIVAGTVWGSRISPEAAILVGIGAFAGAELFDKVTSSRSSK